VADLEDLVEVVGKVEGKGHEPSPDEDPGVVLAPERPHVPEDADPSVEGHRCLVLDSQRRLGVIGLASRYAGKVQAYELWNEENLDREAGTGNVDPSTYLPLLESGSTGVKAGDPNALVLLDQGMSCEAIAKVAAPDYIAVADGGDLLSFARVGLKAQTYLDAGAFGCLGVGTPYAVAAALAFPGRQVICVTGDGAFGINAMEIDTAVRHGARAVFIVSNNAAWNIERYDQEVNYGGRVVGTTLRHSDYAAMARALGAHGERVESAADLPAALERALANAPALIDVVTSQSAVSSDAKKGLGFVPDYQPLEAWNDPELRRRLPG